MPPRNRAWSDTIIAGTLLTTAAPVRLDLLADAPTVDTLTAVRLVGDVTVNYIATNTIVDSLSIAHLGIGVTSLEAFTAGVLSMPSPGADDEYPPRGWIYVASLPVKQQAESAGVIDAPARFIFDIRSMRKIDKGICYVIVKNDSIEVGGAMQVTGRIRVLCLT